ncbi:MAG: hypoxanthine phosphoribosyltransferase, partial [Planctomycetes bacterium]|nr:hypoxanthine phosphoribosyltransferase [Planctomycetota bacterium]
MESKPTLTELYSAEEIQARVSDMAARISSTLKTKHLFGLVVLSGAFYFAADLTRQLEGFEEVELEFIRLQSYSGTSSSGEVRIRGGMPQVAGRDVLVIEDLLDTGLTLASLSDILTANGARSVRYAVLIDKRPKRSHELAADFVAFELDEDA